ncbi:PAS domain-containing protein [Rhodospirillaceae bacterium KN72]|uniref:PAS domain-containing protein n=1 Tax=Pacificispira spongiicola TaxID=2729598 RepID=A0A7Y0DWP3_9PROT|nr:PAS domain-containing protein [Pacificispira spongiicola]NMM42958.1 PAS domain-containing protein [Pacificispira spongiicola]
MIIADTGWRIAVETALSHLTFPETRDVLTYWAKLRDAAGSDLPDRTDIDPIEIRHTLPHVYLMELEPETGRLLYRLAGDEINSRYKQSINGKYLDEITAPTAIERVQGYFKRCMHDPAIIQIAGILYAEHDAPGFGERLILPLRVSRRGTLGILGMTYQVRQFPNATAAEEGYRQLRRTISLETGAMEITDTTPSRS